MSELRMVEVDPTTVAVPATGGKTIFVDDTSHLFSVKDETNTVTVLGGAVGLAVGGSLAGTLPNPTLTSTGVSANTYGDSTHVAVIAVSVEGRITSAVSTPITGAAPSGSAGGVLGGTYPNPTLGAFSSSDLKAALTDETGSGAAVFGTAPTITLANGTGLPISTGVSGLGTGVATFLATPSSANLASALTDETGSGAAVFGTGPTLSNPVVGTQTAGDNSTKAASTAYADNAVAKQAEVFMVAISDEVTALTTGTAKITFRMPFACSMTALPRANVNTVSSSGLPTFDIKKNGTTIFSTTLTIDASEKTSVTAATPAVLTSSPTTFADDDEITIDISTAGTGTKGAKITLNVVRT